jgi:hypothetical protein
MALSRIRLSSCPVRLSFACLTRVSLRRQLCLTQLPLCLVIIELRCDLLFSESFSLFRGIELLTVVRSFDRGLGRVPE